MRFIKKILFVALISIGLVSLAQKPILPDFHADPSAHEWDGRYWIYPSTDEPGSTSWKEIKRWHCFSSPDLSNWTNHDQIFSLDDVSWASHSAFAPDCMKWKGKYYCFFPAEYNADGTIKPVIMTKEGVAPIIIKSNTHGGE
jgi:beta-xylosidase